MLQTAPSIQMHHPIHLSKSLPTLSKFQFKHITQMFTFSGEIWEFSSGYTKTESESLWSNKPSYSKAKALSLQSLLRRGQEDWEVAETMASSTPITANLVWIKLSFWTHQIDQDQIYVLTQLVKKRNCLF